MKHLLDEMLPDAIAEQLRNRGHDVVCVTEHGRLRGSSGSSLLDIAQAEGRVIVTQNIDDFRRIATARLRQGSAHAGVIFSPNDVFPRGNPRTIAASCARSMPCSQPARS